MELIHIKPIKAAIINEDFFDDEESRDAIVSDINSIEDDIKVEDESEYDYTFSMEYWLMNDYNEAELSKIGNDLAKPIGKMINKLFSSFDIITKHSPVEFWAGYGNHDTVQNYNGYLFHHNHRLNIASLLYLTVSVNCKFRSVRQVVRFINSALNTLKISKAPLPDSISFLGISFKQGENIFDREMSIKDWPEDNWNDYDYSNKLYKFASHLLPGKGHVYEQLRTLSGRIDDDIDKFISDTVPNIHSTKSIKSATIPSQNIVTDVSGRFLDMFYNIERVYYCAYTEPDKKFDGLEFNDDWLSNEKRDFMRDFLDKSRPACHIRLLKYTYDGEKYVRILFFFDKTAYIEDTAQGTSECDVAIYVDLGFAGMFSHINVNCKPVADVLTPLHYLGIDINKILLKLGKWFSLKPDGGVPSQLAYHFQQNIRNMQ